MDINFIVNAPFYSLNDWCEIMSSLQAYLVIVVNSDKKLLARS